jgi:uncharacterized protein (TIGR01777 family)
LTLRLLRDDHAVTAWVRDIERARQVLGAEVELVQGDEGLLRAVELVDVVVNLAGEPVAGRRWSSRTRKRIEDSRVGLTRQLVAAIENAERRPQALVSASAVGYYGDRGDAELTEDSPAGRGFLADVCVGWEREALEAEKLGLRVALLRIGVVLGPGGALARLVPIFSKGLGGRLGHGRQWMPWIHVEDLIEAIVLAISDGRARGPINMNAEPITNRELVAALGRVLGRATPFPVPRTALKLVYGAAASVLLDSQRALPARLRQLGFRPRFETVEEALSDLLGDDGGPSFEPHSDGGGPGSAPYLKKRPPRHLLFQIQRINAPRQQVFAFFSQPENLGPLTPPDLSFQIRSRPEGMRQGAVIEYRIKLGPIPMRWRTVIERWERPRLFVDAQHVGPYRSWWHEHRFRGEGRTTVMEDRVRYALPFGLLGRIVHRLFVAPKLRGIFSYRALAIRLRFGEAAAPSASLEAA